MGFKGIAAGGASRGADTIGAWRKEAIELAAPASKDKSEDITIAGHVDTGTVKLSWPRRGAQA